jgi:hypothetical protein
MGAWHKNTKYVLLVDLGRATCPGAARTRAYRFANKQMGALRAPPPPISMYKYMYIAPGEINEPNLGKIRESIHQRKTQSR